VNPDRATDIAFYCGAPGSGKSFEIHAQLARRKPGRLIVVDPDGEYPEAGVLHSQLPDAIRATCYSTFRTRFRASHVREIAERQFDVLCQTVRWHVDPQPGQQRPPAVAGVVFVVDELAEYVGSSFRESPESWQWLIKRGRKYGVSLLAASQRPQHIDKTLYDLCSTLRTGRINGGRTQAILADALDVPTADVRALTGHQFIQRDKNTGKLTRGG
jgi:hypothetical protein